MWGGRDTITKWLSGLNNQEHKTQNVFTCIRLKTWPNTHLKHISQYLPAYFSSYSDAILLKHMCHWRWRSLIITCLPLLPVIIKSIKRITSSATCVCLFTITLLGFLFPIPSTSLRRQEPWSSPHCCSLSPRALQYFTAGVSIQPACDKQIRAHWINKTRACGWTRCHHPHLSGTVTGERLRHGDAALKNLLFCRSLQLRWLLKERNNCTLHFLSVAHDLVCFWATAVAQSPSGGLKHSAKFL